MGVKRVLGIIVMLIGFGLIGISVVGNKRLAEGTLEIANAKSKVKTTDQIFSLSPYTKDVGKQISGSAQGKISDAEATVAHYAQIFQWCQYGGIALAVIGLGIVIFCPPKKKQK